MYRSLNEKIHLTENLLGNYCCNTCFIIPEYVNKSIYENGSKKQKLKAWQNLIITEQLRGLRHAAPLLRSLMQFSSQKYRTIYNAQNSEELPGTVIRVEGDSKRLGGSTVSEAYNYSGYTYDFFNKVFDRNSINDNGLRLDSTVHYGEEYNNAFWNGTQMVYGDGDGEIFDRFTKCIDVVAHELTHGITQYEAALLYTRESGALNESFSDVFGSLVKQYVLKQTVDKADWLIGKGLFTKKVKGVALRSMKEPGTAYNDPVIGKDEQKGHMNSIFKGKSDNGGVHINSGIPNKAFYLSAMEIGGYAWEKVGRIWYIALRDKLRSRHKFQKAAEITFEVAGSIYGRDSVEQKAVFNGWKGVGIHINR
jgi:Zn-dependent metalloprotease